MLVYEFRRLSMIADDGPLTAGEIAETLNLYPPVLRGYQRWTAQGVANQLRPLVRRGLLRRRGGGIYELTATGRAVVDA